MQHQGCCREWWLSGWKCTNGSEHVQQTNSQIPWACHICTCGPNVKTQNNETIKKTHMLICLQANFKVKRSPRLDYDLFTSNLWRRALCYAGCLILCSLVHPNMKAGEQPGCNVYPGRFTPASWSVYLWILPQPPSTGNKNTLSQKLAVTGI